MQPLLRQTDDSTFRGQVPASALAEINNQFVSIPCSGDRAFERVNRPQPARA